MITPYDYATKLYVYEEDEPIPHIDKGHKEIVSIEELKRAITNLSSGKAIGVDGLADNKLKFLLNNDELVFEKMRSTLNMWLNANKKLPTYLCKARTILLSKDKTPFPPVGKVRIIVCQNAILKLYEQVLLARLKAEASSKLPLHPRQRGFVHGKSTVHNIADVLDLVDEIKKRTLEKYTRKAIPVKKRKISGILVLDLKKAFDQINQPHCMMRLLKAGINQTLVRAIATIYRQTSLIVDDKEIKPTRGVAQGSAISPTLFALAIDELLCRLNSFTQAWAFADDLCVAIEELSDLKKVSEVFDEMGPEIGLSINMDKSAFMPIVLVKNAFPRSDTLEGFKVVKDVKYLGMTIACDGSLKLDLQ